MIRINITYKEKRLITPLYKVIVRPHLEYCIQAWSPYLRKYIDMLEKIQRRATKLIPGLQPNRDFCFNLHESTHNGFLQIMHPRTFHIKNPSDAMLASLSVFLRKWPVSMATIAKIGNY